MTAARGQDRPLAGQVAVVTGASRGIGQAIAVAYGQAGAHVYCAARSMTGLRSTALEIESAGGAATPLELDVVDESSVAAAFATIGEAEAGLDLAVLNAGIGPEAANIADSSPDDWRSTFDVNVFGVVSCATHAIPLLVAGDGGKIIVTGSGTGRQGNAQLGAYAASKAAVASVVKTLAVELRDDRIAVNELVPGPVATAMTGYDDDGAPVIPVVTEGSTEWFKAPKDLADLALLMASFPNHGPSGQVFSLMGRLM
jgi:3-oxoacyl-[acyl-carrier protein] reductase